MSCNVTILSVVPYGSTGQPVSSVVVKGSATECSGVVVKMTCGGLERIDSVSVNAQGLWQVTFENLNDAHCRCDDPNSSLAVSAYCKANPDCSDRKILQPISCQPYPCPTINHVNTQIPNCDQVMQAGVWNVTFSAVVNGTGVTNYVWSFGDGQSLSGSNLQQVTHAYQCAGTYVVTLVILSDCETGYANISTITINLPPCGCPTVQIIAEPYADNPCKWNFKASIGGPFVQCIDSYLWNFGDGIQEPTSIPSVNHTYSQNGQRTMTLTLLGDLGQAGGGPCYATKDITVTNCRGGNGNGHHPCPWWNPFCKGWSLCGLILLLALASILSAGPLLIAGWCSGIYPLIIAGAAAAVAGLALLALWYALCKKIKPEFCNAVNDLICIITYIEFVQSIVVLIMAIAGTIATPCGTGALITWGYYGTVLTYLLYIRGLANCPHAHCGGVEI